MAEPTGEPQNKKQKIETKEEEEEQEEGCVEYKLFVAIEDTKGKPEKGDEEEEDIGSEDSDEDSEEEEEEGLLVYKWDDLNFGEDVLEKVKKMSSSLYDHSDEGFQEIEAATTKKTGEEKESEEEDDGEEEKGNGELITLDKVDLAAMLVVKICKDKGTAEITQLFTDPEYRDRGVGNDLTNAALCFVQETYEVKHVDVFAVCGSGPFYKKVGFEYVSNEKGDSNDLAEDKDDSEQPERCIMRYTFPSGTQSTSEEEDDDGEDDDDEDDNGDEDDDDNEDEDDSENDNENDDENDSDGN